MRGYIDNTSDSTLLRLGIAKLEQNDTLNDIRPPDLRNARLEFLVPANCWDL
jgi:hypothetical protein